jgi:hypothetical protein
MNDDDSLLFDWLRYYGAIFLLCTVLGGAAGIAYSLFAPAAQEASTLVVQVGARIPAAQVGSVATAIFRTPSVSDRASLLLQGRLHSAELTRDSGIDPVPGTDAVLVTGIGQDITTAEAISKAMAQALVDISNRKFRGQIFTPFSGPQPSIAPQTISPLVATALGMTLGLWLSVLWAIAHYRRRRPILSLDRAARISGATEVTSTARRLSWLGFLRGRPRGMETAAAFSRQGSPHSDGVARFAAHPGTNERDLLQEIGRSDRGVELIWVQ